MNTLQELLEPKRASSNLSDTDIRRIAIDSIAVQFLNTESTGEIREYLVDTTLPQLVMALERLLKKVSQSPDINAPKLPRKTANDLDSPIHVQKQPFDCVIWLAQDLMRNNHSKEKSMYEIRMMEISKELHKKIAELKVVEIDNANRIKYQLIAENSAASELSDQLNRHLTVLFYDCLRSVNLMVTSNVSVVLLKELVQAAANLENKASSFLNQFSDLLNEFTNSEKLNCDEFIALLAPLLHHNLTLEHSLHDISKLQTVIARNKNEYELQFFDRIYIPSFTHPSIDWKPVVFSIIELWDCTSDPNSENIKKSIRDYINGVNVSKFDKSLDFTLSSFKFEVESTVVHQKAYCNFGFVILGDFGVDSFTSLMTHVRFECEKLLKWKLATSDLAVNSPQTEWTADPTESRERFACKTELILFFSAVSPDEADNQTGVILHSDIEIMLELIQNQLSKSDSKESEKEILVQMRARLAVPSTIDRSQIIQGLDGIFGSEWKVGVLVLQKLVKNLEASRLMVSLENTEIEKRLEDENNYLQTLEIKLREIAATSLARHQYYESMSDVYFTSLSSVFGKLYPGSQTSGRITVCETGVHALPGADPILGEDEEKVAKSAQTEFLRTIGCSSDKQAQYGHFAKFGSGVGYQVIRSRTPLRITDSNDPIFGSDDAFVVELKSSLGTNAFNFVSVLLDGENMNSIYNGTVDIVVIGGQSNMSRNDVKFIQKTAEIIVKFIRRVDLRNLYLDVIESSKLLLRLTHDEIKVRVFLLDAFSKGGYYSCVDDGAEKKNIYNGSVFLSSDDYVIKFLDEKDADFMQVDAVFGGNEVAPNAIETNDGSHQPIWLALKNSQNRCTGAIEFDGISNDTPIAAIQSQDLEKFVKQLSFALMQSNQIIGKPIDAISRRATITKLQQQGMHLSGEMFDASAKRKLLFGKILFEKARNDLELFTSGSFAELKSYKSPPKSVQIILNSVLYLFGKSARDLKNGWRDTLRHFDLEFVASLTKYDPTVKQKKLWARRTKKSLKTLTALERKTSSSGPADIIYEWLITAVVLKDVAIANRKARPDLFSREITSAGDSESIADLEEIAELPQEIVQDIVEAVE